eukprot:2679889-Rhodomonas_salina.1
MGRGERVEVGREAGGAGGGESTPAMLWLSSSDGACCPSRLCSCLRDCLRSCFPRALPCWY